LPETVHARHDMVRATRYDVVVIGAGINGAGIARDAAMRGLKVLLIEKGEIGAGTTSASTRLIHGGLRYLEHFEFGLVYESLRERETLLRIAPEFVRPLAMVIPIYKQSRRGWLTIRAGMILYDLLSWGKSLPRHRMLSRAETRERWPGLNPEGLIGSTLYYDAQVEFPERLVLANVQSAQEFGAEVLTHTRVTGLTGKGVEFGDRFAEAGVVINAAGPWIDLVLAPVKSPKLIGGTKGSHIVVAPFQGAPENAIYLEARSDGRPIFIIPWNKLYLIGTTDVPFNGDPDQVQCEDWEIDYLLSETNLALPGAQLTRDNILQTYSGVRPLPYQSSTRRHFIREHPQLPNLLSIVGGKLTTYRSLAEECVDLIFRKLGKNPPPCRTAIEVLKSSEFKL
jgi:glycerol-3-phosphate dehydrogenase